MAPKKLIEVVEKYLTRLEEFGFAPENLSQEDHSEFKALTHVTWMCQEIKNSNGLGDPEKAARWLGFIQGVLWVRGLYTINEMREHNR